MVKGWAFLSVIAAVSVVSGCDEPPPLPSVDAFCEGVCTGVARCGSGQWSTCYTSCRTDPRNGGLATVRPEAAAVVDDCLAALDCETILNGPFDTCWDQARAETAPSAHLRAICPSYSTSAFDCGYWFSVEDCEAQLSIWTDAFLDELAACTHAATCEETDACFDAKFGGA